MSTRSIASSRSVRATVLGLVLAAVATTTVLATAAGAQDAEPVVTVAPGPVETVTGPGGTCWVGSVSNVQPTTFVVSRTGPTDALLPVDAWQTTTNSAGGAPVSRPLDVVIPAGAASVVVPIDVAATVGSTVQEQVWELAIEDTDRYAVGTPSSARVTGYVPADPERVGSCARTDRHRSATVVVGEPLPSSALVAASESYELTAGQLPPGLELTEVSSISRSGGPALADVVRGTPAQAGRYRFSIRDCPLPAVGERICGTTDWDVTVLAPKPRDFTDVAGGSWYADAVYWLYDRMITTGCAATRFCPASHVTRAQTAAFLHRLAGSPTGPLGPHFDDVPAASYYSTATRWMRAVGLTTGVDGSDRFDPHAPTSRAQLVTLLHRYAGSPGYQLGRTFTDVPAGAYYGEAVRFAAVNGITTGVGGRDRFEPHRPVTRAEAAAFLQRFASGTAGGVLPIPLHEP